MDLQPSKHFNHELRLGRISKEHHFTFIVMMHVLEAVTLILNGKKRNAVQLK